MKEVRDTFLRFLGDNLAGQSIHYMRRDPDNPQSDVLSMDSINVGFFDLDMNTDECSLMVAIDIVYYDEMAAVTRVTQVWRLLKQCMTPLKNYENPASPTLVGGNVFWDRSSVLFRKVDSDNYSHFSCLMPLRFHYE